MCRCEPPNGYRRANRYLLAALVLALAYPVVLPWVARHTPWWHPVCALELLTRRRCPTCGVSTGLRYLFRGELAHAVHANVLTVPVALVLAFEFLLRFVLSVAAFRPTVNSRIMRVDGGTHLALLAAYVVYVAYFFVSRLC